MIRNTQAMCQRFTYCISQGEGQGFNNCNAQTECQGYTDIAFAKGGPRFPIAHELRLIATTLQANMPAVCPEMTIWGVGRPIFLWLNLIFFVT